MARPHVSVIIPARNAETTIGEQLEALTRQDYRDEWELLIADNGCTDDTLHVAAAWSDRLPLRIVDARARPGAAAARNIAGEAAAGSLLVFCDADDVVQPGWLTAIVDAAGRGDLVGGRISEAELNDPALRWEEPWPEHDLPVPYGFRPYAIGANCAVHWTVIDALGGWDERFRRSGDDIEFCWRAQLAGYELVYAPDAIVWYRHRTAYSAIAVQSYRAGFAGRMLVAAYVRTGQPVPSVLPRGIGKATRAVAGVALLPFSRSHRVRWVRQVAYILGWIAAGISRSTRIVAMGGSDEATKGGSERMRE